ncbi:Acetyl-coenzyme A carboxylase carboxyl transferase subunit alpha [Frankliniella fusca]|uniref:Acetyl-coenzyme A carboxylase carboxyl transferase subunit alpha n=1 Tax=Frankliniella fusca TaxID=407009 RepID=A0AAE1GUR4_9NEOP|nr:Acetyl-coenzyme A carboxylase carboxyl transferase subunit alpha [Frankliniella fusca]
MSHMFVMLLFSVYMTYALIRPTHLIPKKVDKNTVSKVHPKYGDRHPAGMRSPLRRESRLRLAAFND